MPLSTIEIDFEIHRLIENERKGFEEPPYVALRRLLKLAPQSPPKAMPEIAGKQWEEDGVVVPHGTKARMSYQYGRQRFEGEFLDGFLVVNGRKFDTLSSAASALARTKSGHVTSLNGWLYWEVQFPDTNVWTKLQDLRSNVSRKL